ncbi:cation:proton antiporter [Arcobacteraceae bacterium]|nr:cation:proton antiporter [Arcobacteraceae bacterium]
MLTIIVATLFISLVLNVILKKIHLPTIIGYIVTGTIIAYGFGLHDAVHNHELKETAEFGVVFLMFTIGLEFSIEHLKKMKYEVFVAGSLQIIITSLIVYLMAFYVFNIDQQTSFIISLAIALSSTAIVLKTFNETGEISKRYGQRTLGILIMQDIAVIPILLVIGFMSNSDGEISTILLEMLVSATLLLTALWLFGKYLLEPFFTQIIKTKSDELFIGTILFLAIGASYFAHQLGFSYSLGAFIAGMLIAETKYKHQAEAELIPFRDILLGIFFITVGMQISFDIIFEYIHIILLILVLAFILKFVIIYAIVKLRDNKRTSFKTALSLIQIGEFSLALLELARTNELVADPYGQIMIVTIVISMILTPFILKNSSFIADKFLKDEKQAPEEEYIVEDLSDHIVILGFGEFGRNLAENLTINKQKYIAIENNIDTFHKAHSAGLNIIFGNASKKKLLHSLHLEKAKKVVVAIDNHKKLYQTCENLLTFIDEDKIIIKVHSEDDKTDIEELGIHNIYVENEIASRTVASIISVT